MKNSNKLFTEAQKSLVGGVNSPVRCFKGVGGTPVFIDYGNGAFIFDVDKNRYVDFVGSWGPLICGHAHPNILSAIESALKSGWSYGAPVENEIRLAEEVLRRHEGLEKIRFVSSGTEATLSALRLARGVTGRDKIVKFAGCYHGHVDALLVEAGSGLATLGSPSSAGIPESTAQNTYVLPYNNGQALKELLEKEGDQIAAVIVEPVAGNMGVIPPLEDFVKTLKEETKKVGSLLIIDEVMTGFRVGENSARGRFDIPGDIVTFGKVIGGGMPVGAYAASAEIMGHVAPLGNVYQAGTLSGNPLAMAAGLATLKELTPKVYEQFEKQGENFAQQLRTIFTDAGVPSYITQVGSMVGIFFCEGPVHNFDDAQKTDADLYGRFFHACLEEGVYLAPSAYEACFISTAHNPLILGDALDGIEKAIKNVCHTLNT